MAGPFKITKQVGNLYKVKLPESMRIYNIFSPDRLQKAASNPLEGQVNKPPLPTVITTKEEWEVQEVLASKLAHSKLKYHIN